MLPAQCFLRFPLTYGKWNTLLFPQHPTRPQSKRSLLLSTNIASQRFFQNRSRLPAFQDLRVTLLNRSAHHLKFMREYSRYADPPYDIPFKKLFADDTQPQRLISFLNAALKLEGNQQITSLEILDTSQLPPVSELKRTYVDIKARDILRE